MCVEVIVCYIIVVFLRQGVYNFGTVLVHIVYLLDRTKLANTQNA